LAGCKCKPSKTATVAAHRGAQDSPEIAWCGLQVSCNSSVGVRQDLKRVIGQAGARSLEMEQISHDDSDSLCDRVDSCNGNKGGLDLRENSCDRNANSIADATTLSGGMLDRPVAMLHRAVVASIRPWRRPLFLDLHALGLARVIRNAAELGVVSAGKVLAMARRLPVGIRAGIRASDLAQALRGIGNAIGSFVARTVSKCQEAGSMPPTPPCNQRNPLLLCGPHFMWDPRVHDVVPVSTLGQQTADDPGCSQPNLRQGYSSMFAAALGV